MTMPSEIERIALLAADSLGAKVISLTVVRAVIAAMAVPSEAMVDAMVKGIERGNVRDAWRAGIDAALDETETTR